MTLRWTKERPAVPGSYWRRGHSRVEIVQVMKPYGDKVLFVFAGRHEDPYPVDGHTAGEYEYAGPIAEPVC